MLVVIVIVTVIGIVSVRVICFVVDRVIIVIALVITSVFC